MISIIMSAFNAQQTIEKAINSCLEQTFKDIEIIVVNDCSTDNTKQIVENLIQKDSRIKLINHLQNQGAGLARRTGISHIQGEYMTFLDSDDYLKEDCLETLHNAIIENKVDIVAPGYITVDDNHNIIDTKIPDRCIQENGHKFKPNKQDTKRFMNPMLIKSSLWKQVEYSSRRFIEDTPTLVQILYYAKKIMLLDYAGYYYVQNPTSLIHSASSLKYTIYRALCAKDINEFFKDKNHKMYSPEAFMKVFEEIANMITKDNANDFKDEIQELFVYLCQLIKD